MSRNIDERVVEMRFENRDFEKNVQTSLSTLERLKSSLNLEGATKGFESVDRAAGKVNFDGLWTAIDSIQEKFSVLEIAAISVLSNIANSAYETGKKFVKSLSTDQIIEGWDKYATKTAAIQTIMAATRNDGWTSERDQLNYVEGLVEKLNWFTDETSYNLVDMISAIGQFTSKGVGLEDAVTDMMGIANWAAISGANTEQASHVMFELSQALGGAAVRAQDWRSVQSANMSTVEFKEILLETAAAMGVIVDLGNGYYKTEKEIISATQGFESSLKDNWLNKEVLSESLKVYGGFSEVLYDAYHAMDGHFDTVGSLLKAIDLYKDGSLDLQEVMRDTGMTAEELIDIFDELSDSTYELGREAFKKGQEAKTFAEAIQSVKDAVSTGWATTFELIFGDYMEARELWTDLAEDLYDLFAEPIKARNEMLGEWKDMGGRDLLFSGPDSAFVNAWEGLVNILGAVKDAFHEVFPPMTADKLLDITRKVRDLTKKFRDSTEDLEGFKGTLKGVFSIFDILGQIVGAVVHGIGDLLGLFSGSGKSILNFTGGIGETIYSFDQWLKKNEIFKKAVDGLVSFIKTAVDKINGFFKSITGLTIGEAFEKFTSAIKDFLETNRPRIDGFITFIKGIPDKVNGVFRKITGMGIGEAFSRLGGLIKKVVDKIKGAFGGLGGVLQTVKNIFDKILDVVKSAIKKIKETIEPLFENFQVPTLMDIIKAVLTGFAGFFVYDMIVMTKEISWILDALRTCLLGWQHDLNATALLKIAIALVFLSIAISKLSQIESSKIVEISSALGLLLAEMVGAMAILSSVTRSPFTLLFDKDGLFFKGFGKGTMGTVTTMLALAGAIAMLAGALKNLSDLDTEQIANGITAIGILMLELSLFISKTDFNTASFGASVGMIALAAALRILIGVVKEFADMPLEDIEQGLMSVAISIGTLSMFVKSTAGSEHVFSAALGMLLIGAALKIIVGVVEGFAKFEWEELGKGFAAITAIMILFVGFVKSTTITSTDALTKGASDVFSAAAGMVLLAAALKIIVGVVEDFAAMSWMNMIQGLAGMAVAIAAMTIFVKSTEVSIKDGLTTGATKVFSTAAGMVLLAAALKIIVGVVEDFAAMSWLQMLQGLAGVGIVLLELAAFTRLVGTNVGGMLAGAASMVIIGAAMKIIVGVILELSSLSWEQMSNGIITIGASLLLLAVAVRSMEGSLSGAAAAVVVAAAIAVLSGSLILLAQVPFMDLISSAGALVIALIGIGATAAIITPVIPAISALGTALLKFSLAMLTIGLGAALIAAALVAIVNIFHVSFEDMTATLSAFINSLVTVLEETLPRIVNLAVNLVTDFCIQIIDRLPDLLVPLLQAVPILLDALLKVILDALIALVEYTPPIVAQLMILVYTVLEAIAQEIPGVIKAVLDIIASIFIGIWEAIGSMDTEDLLHLVEGIGILTAVAFALSALASVIPMALVGVAGLAAVITALAIVIGVIGDLAKDSGVLDSIKMGGEVLKLLATILGEVLGVFIGGIVEGFTSMLGKMGTDLSTFANNIKPFLDTMSGVDTKVLDGVNTITSVLAKMTGRGVLDSIAAIVTNGRSPMVLFAQELEEFGPHFAAFADSISGVDGSAVESAGNACKVLVEFAKTIPNSGGLWSSISGDNSLRMFGEELSAFGPHLRRFSNYVSGVDPDAVTKAADASTALAKFAQAIPNEGGLWSKITGDNSLAMFGEEVAAFGPYLLQFSDSAVNVDPEAVSKAAEAATALAKFAQAIPNEGGLYAKVSGDNSLSQFGAEVAAFGPQLLEFSNNAADVDADAVTRASTAAKALTDFAQSIPNEGGLYSKISGDNSLGMFGAEMVSFGFNLKKYSSYASDIDAGAVSSATSAAMILTDFAKNIPNEGGFWASITGDNKLSTFGEEMAAFGLNLRSYSISVTGVSPDEISKSVTAATSLLNFAKTIPNSGGIVSWFTGNSSLKDFGKQMAEFGPYLKQYYDSISGISSSFIANSATAAKGMAEFGLMIKDIHGAFRDTSLKKFGQDLAAFGPSLKAYGDSVSDLQTDAIIASKAPASAMVDIANMLPQMSGVVGFFTGNKSFKVLNQGLADFGEALNSYGNSVDGLKTSAITNSKTAANDVISIANELPRLDGVAQWFAGEKKFTNLNEGLVDFGGALKGYGDSVVGLQISAIKNSSSAAISIIDMLNSISDSSHNLKGFDMAAFGNDLTYFGEKFKEYYMAVSGIDVSALDPVIAEVNKLIDMVQNMVGLETGAASGFGQALAELGANGIDAFIKNFTDATQRVKDTASKMLDDFVESAKGRENSLKDCFNLLMDRVLKTISERKPDFSKSGIEVMETFITAVKSKETASVSGIRVILDACIVTIRNKYSDFYRTGQYAVEGFADGITSYTWMAEARSRAMAQASLDAARNTLAIRSPSKAFEELGNYSVRGYVKGVEGATYKVRKPIHEMGEMAVRTMSETLSKIDQIASSEGMFSKSGSKPSPTITPVVDSTELDRWSGRLDALFNSQKVVSLDLGLNNGILGMLSDILDNRNNDDVVAAINDLRNDVAELTDIVGNLQVVMDTGTLVGAIVNPMDEALGEKMVYAGRGMGS